MEKEKTERIATHTEVVEREPETMDRRITAMEQQIGTLRNLFTNLGILEAQTPRSHEQMRNLTREPGKIDRYLAIDAIRSRINESIEKLNVMVPDGAMPIGSRLDASMESMHAVADLARRHQANLQREQLGVFVPPDQHVGTDLHQAIGEYLKGFDWDRRSMLSSVEDVVERWKEKLRSFERLGLVETENMTEVERRSLTNMRSFLVEFLEDQKRRGKDPVDVERTVMEATNLQERNFVMAYYKQPVDIAAILSEGRLRNLLELDAEKQEDRKKSQRTLADVTHDRRKIETALGWQEGDQVYHFTVEDTLDEKLTGGAHTNYGSVRLVLDYDSLKENSTFTVGDSLNDGGVPAALRGTLIRDKVSSVLRRQITDRHIPMAKAMLRLASEEDNDDFRMGTRYLEAQVGKLPGSEVLSRLKEIVIRQKELENEQRNLGVVRASEAQDALATIRKYCEDNNIPLRIIP